MLKAIKRPRFLRGRSSPTLPGKRASTVESSGRREQTAEPAPAQGDGNASLVTHLDVQEEPTP
jgi:hypothetical protein